MKDVILELVLIMFSLSLFKTFNILLNQAIAFPILAPSLCIIIMSPWFPMTTEHQHHFLTLFPHFQNFLWPTVIEDFYNYQVRRLLKSFITFSLQVMMWYFAFAGNPSAVFICMMFFLFVMGLYPAFWNMSSIFILIHFWIFGSCFVTSSFVVILFALLIYRLMHPIEWFF